MFKLSPYAKTYDFKYAYILLACLLLAILTCTARFVHIQQEKARWQENPYAASRPYTRYRSHPPYEERESTPWSFSTMADTSLSRR